MRPLRLALALVLLAAAGASAQVPRPAPGQPVEVGRGGAVATVDPHASRAAIGVLRAGGNAVDAAVAALAVLGVVEPFSAGIGGGGFIVLRTRQGDVFTIDGRESAPASMRADSFIDPATGRPYPFATLVTSGLGVGVPGAVAAWEEALERFGTRGFATLLRPAVRVAREGFVVDPTFEQQVRDNAPRFADFTSSAALYLDSAGAPPAAGTVHRNPDLAATLGLIARSGAAGFHATVGPDIAATVQRPPVRPGAERTVLPGGMTADDVAGYDAFLRPPTRVRYRGLDVYGMGPPSSGGSTVGEALNILEGFGPTGDDRAAALHAYLEASALAFADRNAYLGDPAFTPVPLCGLLSQGFADARRALVAGTAMARPVPAGDPAPFNGDCPDGAAEARSGATEGPSTTHVTVADRRGNVVSATFTIEQTGGSGIVVPGRGFLLNNELTDFETTPGRPNSPAAHKRPRSSMAPTIVERGGRPFLALGSPGGATIITTVLQALLERIDLGRSLPAAIEAPRLSSRNGTLTDAEPDFMASPLRAALEAQGHRFQQVAEIGAATAIEFLPGRRMRAVAEATRRGGGSARALP